MATGDQLKARQLPARRCGGYSQRLFWVGHANPRSPLRLTTAYKEDRYNVAPCELRSLRASVLGDLIFRPLNRLAAAKKTFKPSSYMSDRHYLKTTAPLVFALVALLAAPQFVWAQDEASGAFGNLLGGDVNPLQRLGRFSAAGAAVPLEGAVDAQSYVVGPGDLFSISVGGSAPLMLTVPVSADGYLMLPDAGAVEVAGSTLEEARRRATQALRDQFQRVRLEVTLAQPRQFYVHVSGAVPSPGRLVATPVARVATVLYMAFADTTRSPVGNMTYRPAMRNVRLIHKDGREQSVDLLRYFSTGNTQHNPYLRDGDVISLPTYDPNYDAIFVSGAVAFPGTYDFRPDDTLYDVLVLTTGQNPPRGFSRVRLSRTNEDGSVEATIYDVANLDGSIRLQRRDQIHALAEETVRGSATISGWVQYPGTYPIVPGRTSLRELVELAGGLRPGALERGAYLERATLPLPRLERSRGNRFEVIPGDVRMVRQDTSAILMNTRLATIDFLSRAYLAQEMRLQSRVPIDLESVLDGNGPAVRLEDGDRIVVPRDENSVFVFGHVNRPGYVAVEPGRDASYYIAASGGRGDLAGSAYVIETGTGRYFDADGAAVKSGDLIFVDRRENRADTAELQRLLYEEKRADRERRSLVVQYIFQGASAVAALLTTYLLIQRE